jgi:exodeoxyribonuclease VII small subunit
MTPDKTPAAPAASYADATEELDRILADLERDDLDIDVLAERVRRAAELLTWCRGRIRAASEDVTAAVAALQPDQGDEPAAGSDGPPSI